MYNINTVPRQFLLQPSLSRRHFQFYGSNKPIYLYKFGQMTSFWGILLSDKSSLLIILAIQCFHYCNLSFKNANWVQIQHVTVLLVILLLLIPSMKILHIMLNRYISKNSWSNLESPISSVIVITIGAIICLVIWRLIRYGTDLIDALPSIALMKFILGTISRTQINRL